MGFKINELKDDWTKRFSGLIGRTIKSVRWMRKDETEDWGRAPIVLELDDGTLLWPQSDDEGNDAGALGVQPGNKTKGIPTTAPVI